MQKLVNSIVNEILGREDESPSCSCGCGTCENKDTTNKITAPPALISEDLEFNLSQTKIVDDNNDPLVVYRSQKDERSLSPDRQSKHKGIYFSANEKSTKIYGHLTKKYYLNIKNPIILKDLEWNLSVIPEYLYNHMIKQGYDGAVWLRKGEMYEIVAFYPEQIIPINNTQSPSALSEGINHHLKNKIPFTQNIYRPGSENYFKLYNEVRLLCEDGLLVLEGDDKFLIETTDIGLWGEVNGEKVPLDFPIEEEISSDLPDEYISKYDILYTKTRESVNPNGKPIAKYELSWNGHPIEYGGLHFSSKAELERYADNYDLPINLYKKLRYKDPINEEKKKKLNKPMRDSSGGKAYKVYVKDPKTKKIKTVRFGSGGLRAKINDKKARNAFAKRHKCAQKKDKTKAGYWSCRLPRYAKLLGLKSTFSGFW